MKINCMVLAIRCSGPAKHFYHIYKTTNLPESFHAYCSHHNLTWIDEFVEEISKEEYIISKVLES